MVTGRACCAWWSRLHEPLLGLKESLLLRELQEVEEAGDPRRAAAALRCRATTPTDGRQVLLHVVETFCTDESLVACMVKLGCWEWVETRE